MGDIVHSLPAAAALRRAYPEAKIGWIIEERWAELLATFSARGSANRSPAKPLVDFVYTFDTKAWRENPFSKAVRMKSTALREELRTQEFDIAVDLQAAIRSALMIWLSRTLVRVGFAKPREAPAKIFYTRTVATPAVHVVEQGLQLASAISGKQFPAEFPLPRDEEAEKWCEQSFPRSNGLAIIAPGAGWGAKCWPAERYGEVARTLAQDNLVLVNAGPGEDALALEVARASRGAAQVVACTISQLIALIRRGRLFIGGDTGPLHLAAALGTPVVAIYGPTDPARNGPYAPGGDRNRIVVLRSKQSVTSHARRSEAEPGLLEITVDQVRAAA